MDLPVEIWAIIFGFLRGQRRFTRLLLVSRLFKTIAEPFLYREIVFLCGEIPRRTQQLREIITSHPDRHLAKYVLSYVTTDLVDIFTILPELTNLRGLKLHRIDSTMDFSQPLLRSMQLTQLHCHCRFDLEAFRFFLHSQPTLEYLYFIAPSATFTLSSHALPRLFSLSTGTQGILSILPGRDIYDLTIHDFEAFSAHVSAHPLTFKSVSTLCLHVKSRMLDNVIGAVHSFPNVRLLEIEDHSDFADSFAFRGDKLQFLHQLAATKIWYISLGLWDEVVRSSMRSITNGSMVLKPFFGETSALRVLDFVPRSRLARPLLLGLQSTAMDTKPWLIMRQQDGLAGWSLWWEGFHLWRHSWTYQHDVIFADLYS